MSEGEVRFLVSQKESGGARGRDEILRLTEVSGLSSRKRGYACARFWEVANPEGRGNACLGTETRPLDSAPY